MPRARRRQVLSRTDRPRLYLQSSVFARGSGANPDGSVRRRRSTAWASSAPTGRPACRSSSRTSSTSPACARGRRRPRRTHPRRERAATTKRVLTVTSQQQAAAAMVRGGARRRGRTRRCSSRRRSRAKRRRARAIRRASRASSKSPTRRACSRRREMQDQLARVDVWRALLAQAVGAGQPRARSSTLAPPVGSALADVVDSRRAPPTRSRSWSRSSPSR